jgi:hypothetical protein
MRHPGMEAATPAGRVTRMDSVGEPSMEDTYRKLAVAIAINTVVMYFVTYVNLAEIGHFAHNLNRMYMALLMAAPMVVVMLIVMSAMFQNRKLNVALHGLAAGSFAVLFFLVRAQAPVGDEQFLRSMIPHHSSAILMCERAAITDPEITALCEEIVRSQEEEIARMQRMRARY